MNSDICPKCMKPIVLQHRCEPCCESRRVVDHIVDIMTEYHMKRKLLGAGVKAGEVHSLRRRTLARISQAIPPVRKVDQ